MFNHQGEAERSLTAPLPGPRFIAWWVWTAISFGALVAALWWAGGRRPAWRDEGYVGFVGFLGRVFGGLGTAFRVGDRGASLGARAAFIVALLLLLYVWWRATRAWLAFRPGPVDVQQLEDATRPGTVKPSDTDLTAKLRRCLSESSMYPPTTLPAQAPVEGFLELLGDVELDPHKLGSVLPKVLSRLRPKLAYRVSGILQSRDAVPDQYGMTITVTAFLFGGSRAMTVWGRDWDEVIGKASIWIVSTLLPVTRAGRLPPWSHWWGGELRPELYQAYQEATELGRAGRHHEALEQYFKAVQLDPTNPYLRAELAEMQEKMGLYVDALNTTQRALTLDGQTARAYQKRLWQSRWSPHWRRLRYLRHPRRYREVLGLRYRNSIILGTAEVTAEQWYRREGAQSSRIHEELIPILVERYWPTAVGLDGTRVDGKAPEETKRALRRILQKKKRSGARDHCHGEEERSIRLVFQRASLQETNRLASDDMWARLLLYWPTALWSWTRFLWPAAYVQTFRGAQQAVTRGAFLTNRGVWAPLRLAWASWEYNTQEPPYKWRQRYAWRWRSRISWSALDIRFLERRLTWARRWPTFHRDWLAHYNAACVCAIGMHAESPPEGERANPRSDFARHAIDHLEEAVLIPRRSFAMVERAWMTQEDIDLRALWKNEEIFRDFIRTAYPSPEFSLPPPADNFADEQLREYDYRLLEAVAKVMEQVWQARSERAGVDIHTAASWLRAESEAWESVHEIVDVDRKYNWQDRVDLIHQIETNCHAASSSTPGFPPKMGLHKDPTANRHDLSHRRIDQRLKDLRRYMEPGITRQELDLEAPFWSDTPYSNSQAGQRVLRDAAADGLTWLNAKAVRKIAVRYAATWQRLSDWLELSESQKPFSQAVGKVPQLTRRSLSRADNRKLSI